MKFDVTYRDKNGEMQQMVIDVADRNAVYSELRRQGITPLSLSETGTKKKKAGGRKSSAGSIVVLGILLGIAAFAAWYFLLATGNQRVRVKDMVTGRGWISLRSTGRVGTPTPPPPPPRKGTGAVRVNIAE